MKTYTRSFLTVVLVVLCCFIVTLIFPADLNMTLNVEGTPPANQNGGYVVNGIVSDSAASSTETKPAQTTQAPDTTKAPDTNKGESSDTESSDSKMPTTTQEIIDKYTFLVNKMKAEQPGYKKKEFQSLPEEHRNLGSLANLILDLASGYMTTEEECEEIVGVAGDGTINNNMPIYGSDKGCVLTNYDAVEWAKCEDMGDGTYKISFSLKEEMNAEPTPADTLIPPSNHGAVMSPLSKKDIQKEVDNITGSVPGLAVNSFDLTYHECEFICIYDPATDQVSSITHHIVIDIAVDVKLFVTGINGTARLLNEMLIYDIEW